MYVSPLASFTTRRIYTLYTVLKCTFLFHFSFFPLHNIVQRVLGNMGSWGAPTQENATQSVNYCVKYNLSISGNLILLQFLYILYSIRIRGRHILFYRTIYLNIIIEAQIKRQFCPILWMIKVYINMISKIYHPRKASPLDTWIGCL